MTDKLSICCAFTAAASGLTMIVRIDDQIAWQGDPVGNHDISFELSEDDASHRLVFELLGKSPEHTKLDQAGNIIEDLLVSIEKLTFDEIDVQQLCYDRAVYHHDFNGNGPAVDGRFYGSMGCNGTVTLEFATPVYIWLLENM